MHPVGFRIPLPRIVRLRTGNAVVSMMLQTVPMLGLQRVHCVGGTMLPTADHRPGLGAGWMTSGPGSTHTLLRRAWVRGAHMIQAGRGGPTPMHHQPMKPIAHLHGAVR